MGSTKHEKSFVDFEHPYEQNIIGLKGIVYFGIGLFLLIVITFSLMWALINVLEDDARVEKGPNVPIPMNDMERLPPEPRLQSAPGFSIASENGPVNLELRAPQAEYWELRKQWQQVWDHGSVDPRTGIASSLPIDAAKERLVEQNVKARSNPESAMEFEQSQMVVSDSSSGRMATVKRQ